MMGSVGASRNVASGSTFPTIQEFINRSERNDTSDALAEMTDEDFAAARRQAAQVWIQQAQKKIDNTPFTDEGGGQWTLDIENVGGGSLLDERDSRRAGMGSGPAYGITIWDADYNALPQTIYYASQNEAKSELKRRLKELIESRNRSRT